jgi:hypothetical protein
VHRWLGIAAVLCMTVATPLVAQQTSGAAPPAPAVAPATSGGTTLPGPRLQPEWRSVQPAFVDNRASSAPVSGTHTVTVTTLVLVLVIIIAVLLIVK